LRGLRKLSTKLKRDNNQGYSRHNQLVKENRWDPYILHGIEQQEGRSETQILSTKLTSKRKEVGFRNGTQSIHFLHTLHTDNKHFGQFRVQRNDINQSCQQRVLKSIVHLR
jgi:hypothetical protein